METYYVYIMTNRSGTLYTGMSSDLKQRVYTHKEGMVEGFTKKYRIDRLLYYEETSDVKAAISREKQIKSWSRQKKVELVEKANPTWEDLSEDWF
jgi:putative endonuclease